MIYEHAHELVANGLVNQGSRDCGVDSSGETADYAVGSHLSANLFNLFCDDVARVPSCRDSGGVVEEVLQNVLAELRVLYLRVPLHAVDLLFAICKGGYRGGLGRSQNLKAGRGLHYLIPVTHPANLRCGLARQNLAAGFHG